MPTKTDEIWFYSKYLQSILILIVFDIPVLIKLLLDNISLIHILASISLSNITLIKLLKIH